MSWSLGEIRSLSVKAARGAGMPWGLAEEAGFAVLWLEERSLPGTEALAKYLTEMKEHDAEACPISIGADVSDRDDWSTLQTPQAHQPLLLVPFLGQTADDKPIEVKWGSCALTVCSELIASVSNDEFIVHGVAELRISEGSNDTGTSTLRSRVSDDRLAFVKILEKFAHKTYAPSTEESRAKGAGAGLTDND